MAATSGRGHGRPPACLPFGVARRQVGAVGRGRRRPVALPDFAHVVIVMENRECGQVVGNRSAPFLNSMGRRYAVLPDLYATTHPSFPNYLALIAGSTLGAKATCATCRFRSRTLVDALEAAHPS